MDLTNIIHLYSMISSQEELEKAKQLTQEELKSLNWKPVLVQKRKKKKLNTEKFLENNLSDFFQYMLEYSGI